MKKPIHSNKKTHRSIEKVYFDPSQPGSFSGVSALRRGVNKGNIKVSKSSVKNFLENEDSYTLHKQPKRKFTRRKVIVSGISYLWQCDLIEMVPLRDHNKNYSYILGVIDVFSKKAYARPLKNKTGLVTAEAFKSILQEAKSSPIKCQVDGGMEFFNKSFKKVCEENKITLFKSQDDITKAQIIERWNRTIKNRIYRMFEATGDVNWVESLQDFVDSYNNTYHRSIKMTPNQVNLSNQEEVFQTLYPPPSAESFKNKSIPLKVGDYVRILNPPTHFKKGYSTQWTHEVFKIIEIVSSTSPPVLKIVDLSDEIIRGFFYVSEVQKVEYPDKFIIEKIIKKKGNKVFVKWKHYSDKFNSWVNKSDVSKLFKK